MFKAFISRILQPRHFWRDATFSEVAELYASRTLRVAAVYIGAGFTSVYLLEIGYSVVFIMTFWAIIYSGKALISPLAGLLVSKIGTAKATLISNLLYIPAMLAISVVTKVGFPVIVVFAIFMGISSTLYGVCYYVEFSKVKNPIHAGKEIGFMNILEKMTIAISPLVGGTVALLFGVPVTMWLACILFVVSAFPLLRRRDQSEVRQKFTIRGFPWRLTLPSMLAKACTGFDIVASSVVWGLFVTLFIFKGVGNDIYVIIGALSSVTLIVAITMSLVYGRIIDKNQGGALLNFGVGSNSLVHLSRIFATTPAYVLFVNVVNEGATTAQDMAFLRGMFDVADVSGHRIMYLVGIEMMNSFGAAVASAVMVVCASLLSGVTGFQMFFAISAVAIAGVATARFPIYQN